MTYLELCKRVCSEAGISSTNPTSVKNQVGILNKIVGWVADADLSIQTAFNNWKFLWSRSSFTLVSGRSEYTPGDLGILGGGVIEERQIDAITLDGLPLKQLTWQGYLNGVERTSAKISTGQPKLFAVRHDGQVVFYPTPNSEFSATTDHFKTPRRLVENTDVSLIPERYQLVIVWQALMYYAAQEGDAEVFQMAQINYDKLYDQLVISYAPTIKLGGNVFGL